MNSGDLAGRRTKLTYPGSGLFVNTDYLVTGEATAIRENGATSGVGVLASYGYDNLGNRTSITFGNGASQVFTFDAVSRLASLTNDLGGTTNDLSVTFAYSPASQIASTIRTGDTYAWTGHGNGGTAFTQNGLNQQTSIGGSSASWDSKGNLTTEPQSGKTYGYSSENLLTSASSGVTLAYDPQLRLYQVAGGSTTRFAYDGVDSLAEYNGSNALQRRFVHGPGIDRPIVQYEGTGTTDRRFMGTDERGSIVSLTDSAGALLNINRYDEYGKPQSGNAGRFQYTGQMWLPELGLYHYKARAYLPHIGIFGQTDPIGYAGSPNLYAYVLNDPINLSDPLGLQECDAGSCNGEIVVTGTRLHMVTAMAALLEAAGAPQPNAANSPGNEGGNASPQQQPKQPKPKPTRAQCARYAAGKNLGGLGLDAAGAAILLAFPAGSVGRALGAQILGVLGIGIGSAQQDAAAAGVAFTGKTGSLFEWAGSKVAGRISLWALAGSTAYDVKKTIADYQACMAGRAGP